MFTGIIQSVGKVLSFQGNKKGGKLHVSCGIPLKDLVLGESIAVDGCCLTVVNKSKSRIVFDVSDETLQKTIVGRYKKGAWINLERALRARDRMGGHFVLGHVDGVGNIRALRRTRGSLKITLAFPTKLVKYIIEKGSIAVNGVSLTACEVGKKQFSVYVIPHTEKHTNLSRIKAGDYVNLEADVVGKYVEKCLSPKCVSA